jgi:hypothetical protein
LAQAAQQNGANLDKGFACEGLAQKTGKQLVVPRSKLEDKHDGSRVEGKDDESIGWGTIYPKRSWRDYFDFHYCTYNYIHKKQLQNPRLSQLIVCSFELGSELQKC